MPGDRQRRFEETPAGARCAGQGWAAHRDRRAAGRAAAGEELHGT
jgi:hypothetical protein